MNRYIVIVALSIVAASVTVLGAAGRDVAAASEKVLYAFTGGTDGGGPQSSLVFDSSGTLYGTTHFGGVSTCGGMVGGGCGVVFSLTPGSGGWAERALYAFGDGSDGGFPNAGVILDGAGNLYGTASTGGSTACSIGCGVVYELQRGPSGWSERVLHTFVQTDGQFPNARLLAGTGGTLYSTTWYGGSHGAGTVFALSPRSGGWTESVLYSFTGTQDGSSPAGPLVQDAAGDVYGTTYPYNGYNDGVAFALSPRAHGAWKDRAIDTFGSGAGGEDPYAGVIADEAGNLYGTTIEGGANGDGVVFELVRKSSRRFVEKVLHTFAGADGSAPYAGLVADSAGNLYGTTVFGGSHGYGVVYLLARKPHGAWNERALYSFTGGNDGGYPSGEVTLGAHRSLYGATSNGGTSGSGVVYEVTP